MPRHDNAFDADSRYSAPTGGPSVVHFRRTKSETKQRPKRSNTSLHGQQKHLRCVERSPREPSFLSEGEAPRQQVLPKLLLRDKSSNLSRRLTSASPELLLDFYRKRLEDFDAERLQVFSELKKCQDIQSEVHFLRSQQETRVKEILSLQTVVSNTQLQLTEQRQKAVSLAQENDNLKLELAEYQRKLRHLIGLTAAKPSATESEVTYFLQANRPESAAVSSSPVLPSSREPGIYPKYDDADFVSSSASATNDVVLRVAYLPCDDSKSLHNKIATLEKQLTREMDAHKATLADLQRDGALRAQEHRLAIHNYEETASRCTLRANEVEKQLMDSVERYFAVRYHFRTLEQKYVEETETLKQCLDSLSQQCEQLSAETRRKDNAVLTKNAQDVAHYRQQEIAARQRLSQAQGKIRDVEHTKSEQMGKLEKRLDSLHRRYASAKRERWFELDGFRSECYLIKQKMKAMEDFCGKLLTVVSSRQRNANLKLEASAEYQEFRDELSRFQERLDSFSALLEACLTYHPPQTAFDE